MKKPSYKNASDSFKGKQVLLTGTMLALMALSGCGGGGGDDATPPANGEPSTQPPPTEPTAPTEPAPTQPAPTQPAPTDPLPPVQAISCPDLNGMTVSAASIGLPTGGAEVRSTELIAPSAGTEREYCRAFGIIRPATAGSPNIQFQVNLPTDWNRKALHFGNFGFGGSIMSGTTSVPFAPSGSTPLSRGYATFGSDTGHQGGGLEFALNDEALRNYGGEHVKKTYDVALSLIESFYSVRPTNTYFAGGSTGGREALTAIQRWPADYDGVIASAPTLNFTGMRMNGIRIGRANYAPGGYLNADETNLVRQSALRACDGLDNVRDGIISNVQACRALSENILAAIRCPDGTNQSDTCLSDPQIATVRTVHTDLELPYELADGVRRFQGYNVLEGAGIPLGSDPVLRNPPTAANGNLFSTGAAWARSFMARDESFNAFNFDPVNPGQYQPRIQELSRIIGATNPDLSAFQANGGKLIMMHGLADSVASPNSTIDYYNQVAGRLGQPQVDTFVRFYTVPGFNHESGVFNVAWEALGALDNWVTSGNAPGTLIGTDITGAEAGRTRPMCLYPAYPRFVSGDVSQAASFACVQP
jgi:hypothetical protein